MTPTVEQLLEHAHRVTALTKIIDDVNNIRCLQEQRRENTTTLHSSMLSQTEVLEIFEIGRQAKIASLTTELESLINVISIKDTSSSDSSIGQNLL